MRTTDVDRIAIVMFRDTGCETQCGSFRFGVLLGKVRAKMSRTWDRFGTTQEMAFVLDSASMKYGWVPVKFITGVD